jgi:hypothetical protein
VSSLEQHLTGYLAVRRAMGYKLARAGKLLPQFTAWMAERDQSLITTELALQWATCPLATGSNWHHQRLSVVRGFAAHLHAIDAMHEVPAADLLPWRSRHAVPYLYTNAEVFEPDRLHLAEVLQAAANKSSPSAGEVVRICRVPSSGLTIIKQHFGNRPFRVHEAVDAGIPRHQIYRLRDKGDLVVLSRGVMQSVDSDPAMNTEFAALATRVPDGTICLSSGLSYWDLSDELPARIDLAVPRGAHWPKIDMPATRLHRFAAATFGLDRLARHTDAGEPFWIYSAPRCIVDAMRVPHVVGRDVALAALSRYTRQAGADPLRLTALARQLGGERRIREALEVILA